MRKKEVSLEKTELNPYYVVEFNEDGGEIKNYAGQTVTSDLIKEIQGLDEARTLEDGYYKFYFDKYQGDQLIEKGSERLDVGDGLKSNQTIYERLTQYFDKTDHEIERNHNNIQNKNLETNKLSSGPFFTLNFSQLQENTKLEDTDFRIDHNNTSSVTNVPDEILSKFNRNYATYEELQDAMINARNAVVDAKIPNLLVEASYYEENKNTRQHEENDYWAFATDTSGKDVYYYGEDFNRDNFPDIKTDQQTKNSISLNSPFSEKYEFAEGVSIVDFAEKNDIELSKQHSRHWDYRMADHDSLIIDSNTNKFYWNSRQHGGSVIEFAKLFTTNEQLTDSERFKQSVDNIIKSKADEFVEHELPREEYHFEKSDITKDFSKARNYLVNVRKLDSKLVDLLHDKKLIMQNKYGSAVFPWIKHTSDGNEIVGASEQGTTINYEKYGKRGTFKKIQANSDPAYGYSFTFGKPENLKFFEASIDAISYASMNHKDLKNTRLISMEGLKTSCVMGYLADQLERNKDLPKSIELCVDNDEAGNNFVQKLSKFQLNDHKGHIVDFEANQPRDAKDWNELLVKKVNEKSAFKRSRAEISEKKLEKMKSDLAARKSPMADAPLGQPIRVETAAGRSMVNKMSKYQEKMMDGAAAINQQEERVERLRERETQRKNGLDASGGLIKSVDNISLWQERKEKLEFVRDYNKEHNLPINTPYTATTSSGSELWFYNSAKLKDTTKTLESLQAIKQKAEERTDKISENAKQLAESGELTQWKKNPNIYFIKCIKKTALEVDPDGNFKISEKYSPQNEIDQQKVSDLLNQYSQQDELSKKNLDTLIKKPVDVNLATQYLNAQELDR